MQFAHGEKDGLRILAHARETGSLPSLIAQLRKDYGRAGLDFPFRESQIADEALADLLTTLRDDLYRLLMERFDHYLNLMYAIDLPERAFRQVQPTDAVEVAGQLADLILEREWQKIQFRRRFGGAGPA
jgi:hypothetical protein